MAWEILWPLTLGFAPSGVVQAVVTKGEISRLQARSPSQQYTRSSLFRRAAHTGLSMAVWLKR